MSPDDVDTGQRYHWLIAGWIDPKFDDFIVRSTEDVVC